MLKIKSLTLIILIIVSALVIRIAAFALALHKDSFYRFNYAMFTEIGRNVMEGRWLKIDKQNYWYYRKLILEHPRGLVDFTTTESKANNDLSPVGLFDPGYGLLAGIIWKCIGRMDWRPVILLQILIDALMCFPLYLAGRTLGDPRKGLICASMFALFPLEIFLVIRPYCDVWVSFFYILSVYLLLWEQQQTRKSISLAIVGGMAVLSAFTAWIRTTVVFFVFLIGLYLLLARKDRFQWAKVALLIAIFSFMYMIPKLHYSYTNFGKLNPVRELRWFPFYCGLGQFRNPFGGDGTDGSAIEYCFKKEPELAKEPGLVFYWQRCEELLEPRVKQIIRENPSWYVGTVLKRAGIILFPGLYYHREGVFKLIPSPILIYLQILLVVWSLLFLFGSYIGLRRHFRLYILVLLPYLYTLITISPFFLQGRSLISIYFIQFLGGIEALWYLRHRVSMNSIRHLFQRAKSNAGE